MGTAMHDELEILLPYQRAWIADTSSVAVWEKSRRIGASWCTACLAVLSSAVDGAMDTWYVGYNKEMAEEFVRDCGFWARTLQAAVEESGECLVEDEGKDILAFRIRFASGRRVVALSSRPTNLRGKQGLVVLDEAAFHGELQDLLDAALALLMWGGMVRVVSTHFGADNPFAELVGDIRAGRRPYTLHRTTFGEAVAQGLYRRICQVRKLPWTPEAEARWVATIRAQYGEAAAQELDCIPAKGGGAYLSRALIEGCMEPGIDVLRWQPPAEDFVDWPEGQRIREVRTWCDAELGPRLALVPTNQRNFLGVDFARSGDLSVFWTLSEQEQLQLWTPFTVELRNAPFKVQEQILFYLCDRLPRFAGGALDARGNGQYLAEVARQRYGAQTIAEVMLSEAWYREHMPKLKARLEDRELVMPQDAAVLEDLRSLRVVNGVGRVPETRGKDVGGARHGDAAVALALAVCAVNTLDAGGPPEVSTGGGSESARLLTGY